MNILGCAKPNCERKWSQPGVCNAECFNALLLSDGGAAEARAAGLSCQVKQGFGSGVAAAGSKGLLGGERGSYKMSGFRCIPVLNSNFTLSLSKTFYI